MTTASTCSSRWQTMSTFPKLCSLLYLYCSSRSSCRLVRPQINLHRRFCGISSWWPVLARSQHKQELMEMAEKKEPPDWKHISCPFDHTGKRHVLPVSLLLQLTSFVKEKKDLFVSQVLKEGSVSASTSFSAAESEDVDHHHHLPLLPSSVVDVDDGQSEKWVSEKKKTKLTEGKPETNLVEQDSSQELPGDDRGKVEKKRPNFFVAVQITNPEIHNVARNIQLGIQRAVRVNLRRAIVEVEKFHITLMVMHIPDKEGVQKAVESLNKCVPLILERTCGQPVMLDFEGLSTFNGGRVLFSSPKPSQGLDHLHFMADEVSAQMKHNGIVTTDRPGRQFNPHLTLLKFDGHIELRRKGIKRVEARQYQPYVNEVFGTQTLSSLQLCHMEKKRADGYYLVEHEAFFN